MKKLLIIFLFFALFVSQSQAQNECLENCKITHYNCLGKQENLMNFQHRKQCEGEKSVCLKQCQIQNPNLSVQREVIHNFFMVKSSDDNNVQQCQDDCKKSMFRCQINCKNVGAQCNLDCEVTYRTCLSVTCQQQ
ncbi:hypothetical protein ABPG72_002442 [Tetrahymena utriculariae]